MKQIFPLVLLVLATTAYGQRTISDLQPAHRSALEAYLAKHNNRSFLPETRISASYLKMMRSGLGRGAKPFYAVGDFNNDRVADFAVILLRKGKPVRMQGLGVPHNIEYPMTIAIFNGTGSGRFTTAFTEDIQAPIVSALTVSGRSRKTLGWGVSETDNAFTFKPRGKTYVIEHPDMP